MKKRLQRNLIFCLGIVSCLYLLGFDQKIISWKDAHKYYDKYVTVEGIIVHTYNSGRACFLNFHPDFNKYFTVVIFVSDFHRFHKKPEDFYFNKKVRVSGEIKKYNGKPEIILKDPEMIKIIEEVAQPEQLIEISWKDADKHYNQYVVVKGKIVDTLLSKKTCYLNFHKDWKNHFTAVIFTSDLKKFPYYPDNFYLNKEVKVKGLIIEYMGKPEIILKNSNQIEVVE